MGRISEQTIQQIASANDIVEVIGSYIPLKRAGSAFKANCPFHQERTPSFTVSPSRQAYHCFGCGAGGSVFRFVMQYENVDFPTSARRLAERAGIRIIEEELSGSDERKSQVRKRLVALHAEATEWFHRNLLKTRAAQPARDYLKKRGITAEIARSWKLGFAPDSWDAFNSWAQNEGYSHEEIIRSGLVKVRADEEPDLVNPDSTIRNLPFYDRFRNRVMFPICSDSGETIAFSGRVLSSDAKEAKYVNSPETMLFTKGNVLFGLHKSKRALIDKNSAIVCEGQLDLITAFESGVQNVIAPQGTAFTERQARLLSRFVAEVVLCFDADAAGMKAAERSLPSLLAVGAFIRVAEMPAGHDPDSLIREYGPDAFREQIENARDFFEYQIDRRVHLPEFQTPRGKLEFARKMASFVSLVREAVPREAIINQVCARLDLPPSDFRRMLQQPHEVGKTEQPPKAPVFAIKNNTLRLLCQIAVQDQECLAWMRQQPWQPLLSGDAEGDLLTRILSVEPNGSDGVIHQLSGSLDAAEEAFLSQLALAKPPDSIAKVMQDCWAELNKRSIRRRIEALTAKLRTSGLPLNEVGSIQKEILDLKKTLTDISRPFP